MWFTATGKPLKSLPDLLRDYNLPPGLFPQNIICYEFDETKGKLTVYLPSPCELNFKDSSALRYATRVKGTLVRGKLTNIEGMKTKVLVWVKVTGVTVESYKSDKVWFTAGVKKSRSKDAYLLPQDAVRVQEFWLHAFIISGLVNGGGFICIIFICRLGAALSLVAKQYVLGDFTLLYI